MASSFGGTIKLTGESEYRKALSEISNNLKLLNSELKVVSSGYDRNDKSVSNLSQQNAVLNKKISEQWEKVKVLTQALNDARTEQGESSETAKKWQYELNNAKTELNKLERQLNSNTEEMGKYEDATDDASESSLKLGDIIKAHLISEAIISGVKALASAMKQVGGAVVDLGKQSVESYAEYEQLVGGVETLFGESSQVVQDYAKEAYKNSGLSANEYMTQVTNFSASLLQALGGDTKASADYADMAVNDMADNANKMGTDMASIQNAYQGFAKNNYTMLDNLKLGYGGTKTEMERLLADASELSGKEYDISNLNDVFEAIHLIQQQLGITGTTAEEAEGTIQGSTLAMKASWQNLLTGMADDNADFDTLVSEFVESAVGAMNNMLPRIQQVIIGAGKLIVGLGQTFIDNLPNIAESALEFITTALNSIQSAVPQIIPIVEQLVNSFVDFIVSSYPTMVEKGTEFITNLGEGLKQNLPTFISKALDVVQGFADFLTANTPILIQNGIGLIRNIVQGLMASLPELINRVPDMISQFANVINDNAPTIIMGGVGLIMDIVTGLIQALPTLVANIPNIIMAIVNVWSAFNWIDLGKNVVTFLVNGINSLVGLASGAMSSLGNNIINAIQHLPSTLRSLGSNAINFLSSGIRGMISSVVSVMASLGSSAISKITGLLSPSSLLNVGKNLIKGLWNGISNMTGWILNLVGGFADSVISKIKSMFGIHSPSTVMRDQVGKNLALGVGEGFTDTMDSVTDAMQDALPTEFDTSINAQVKSNTTSQYENMVGAFREALRDVRVVMDDREMGEFVVDTVEKVVYA